MSLSVLRHIAPFPMLLACGGDPVPPPHGGGAATEHDTDGTGHDADQDGFDSVESGGTDCDDNDQSVSPAADEIPYDGRDNDCDPATDDADVDGDGYPAEQVGGTDCDDDNDEIYPGHAEDPYNGADDDCDPATPDNDLDGDAFGHLDDCDDTDANIHPDADELCDGVDNNCNDLVDTADTLDQRWYPDADGDEYGIDDGALDAHDCTQPPGYAPAGGDCDETDPDVHPQQVERCDGVDTDCDGQVEAEVFFVDSAYRYTAIDPTTLADETTPLALEPTRDGHLVFCDAGPYHLAMTISGVSVDVRGVSSADTTVRGAGATPIFTVKSAGVLNLGDVHLSSAAGERGGAITLSNSAATLTDVTIADCTATTTGGALYAQYSDITLVDTTATHNTAGDWGGVAHVHSSTLQLFGSTLNQNRAGSGGGAIHATGRSSVHISDSQLNTNTAALGGAIYASQYSDLQITDSTLSDNDATDSEGSMGGALGIEDSQAWIVRTTMDSNSADSGGAVWLNYSDMWLTDATMSHNRAIFGGAVTASTRSTLVVASSTITGNSAALGGGLLTERLGEISLSYTELSDNSASSTGGAIYNSHVVRGTHCDFIDNSPNDLYDQYTGAQTMGLDAEFEITY